VEADVVAAGAAAAGGTADAVVVDGAVAPAVTGLRASVASAVLLPAPVDMPAD